MGSIIGYVVTAIVTFGLTVIFVQRDDIRLSRKRRNAEKNKKYLVQGVPKRVIEITEFDDVFHYRNFAFYIEGKSYVLSSWIHCNDDYFELYDAEGEKFASIGQMCIRSFQDSERKWHHIYGLGVNKSHWLSSDKPGRYISAVKVIKEVY